MQYNIPRWISKFKVKVLFLRQRSVIKVNHSVVTNKHTDGDGRGNTAIEKYLRSFEERNQTFYNVLKSTKFNNVSFKILLCKNFSLKRGVGGYSDMGAYSVKYDIGIWLQKSQASQALMQNVIYMSSRHY